MADFSYIPFKKKKNEAVIELKEKSEVVVELIKKEEKEPAYIIIMKMTGKQWKELQKKGGIKDIFHLAKVLDDARYEKSFDFEIRKILSETEYAFENFKSFTNYLTKFGEHFKYNYDLKVTAHPEEKVKQKEKKKPVLAKR
ncbi:hypothetical protein KAW38_02550 [Candidatus Micrarchaeota archaeon]|nr:hypothetical protein [Candidatus Micrarchaeota archaeon]